MCSLSSGIKDRGIGTVLVFKFFVSPVIVCSIDVLASVYTVIDFKAWRTMSSFASKSTASNSGPGGFPSFK